MPVYYPPQTIPPPPTIPTVAGRQTLWIAAGACLKTKNNGAAALDSVAIAADRPDLIGVLFANGSDQYTQLDIAMPKAWNLGSVTVQMHWTVNGTATGNVTWNVRGLAVSDNDTINAAFGTAIAVTDSFLSSQREHISPESSAMTIAGSPQTGDRIILQVVRKGSTDTLNTSAYLLGLKLFYTTTAATDD